MRISAVLVWILAFASTVAAKDLSFTASVDQTRIGLDGQVTLTLTVTGEGLGGVPEPRLPAMNDFAIVGTNSSSSTQISFVNGAMSATKTVEFIYALRPKQVGNFTIGAASIQVEGKTYTTDPIRVEVVAGGVGGGGRVTPAPQARQGAGDLAELEKNLVLDVEADRRQAYVGEQVTLIYKLYTRYSLQNVQYGKVPTYTGFWAEPLFDAQQLDFRQEVRAGKPFNAAVLKRIALFPTTAGNRTLDQMEIGCDIPVRSRGGGLFDDFDFFGQVQRVTLRNDPLSIEVLPLPPGAPAGFKGAVGSYAVSAAANTRSVAEGDPVSLKLTVTGTGNLDAVAEPERPASRELRIYDPKVTKTGQKTGSRIGGVKTFEYVVIPEKAGQVVIPPFALVYFDPQKRAYLTATTSAIPLAVAPGKRTAEGEGGFRLSREEITQVGRDIRYLKPDAAYLEDQGGALYANWGFLALQFLPFLALAGSFVYRRHLDRLRGDVAYARRRRSRGEAARRLKTAGRLLAAGEGPEFHSEIFRALSQFLADRLNVPAAGLTADEAVRLLEGRGIEPGLSATVRGIFEKCDFARFAPATIQETEMAGLYGEAETVIGELDRRI